MRSTIQRFFEANHHRLLLFLPVCFGAGAAVYFSLLAEPAIGPWALTLSGIMALMWFGRRNTALFYLCLFLIATLAGFINASVQTHRLHSPVLERPVFWKEVSGHVDDIALDEGSIKVTLKNPVIDTVSPEHAPRKIRITFKKVPNPPLVVGDDIKVKATLFPLPEPVAPAAFDFGRYLYFQGLGAVGYTTHFPEVTTHAATTSNAIDQFRVDFANRIIAAMDPPYGAVAAAITVGEQKAVPEEVNEVLRASGLYHILSISGVHMAIAAGLIFLTIRLLLALWPYAALHWPIKKMAAVLALISSFLYLLAAGSPVPAVRSFIMVAVVFTAILCDRKGISMVSLAWAALLILMVHPDSIISASFQLSFAATAAIIALYERFGSALYKPSSGITKHLIVVMWATVIVSLVATFATSPFVIHHFNRFQPWGMIANAAVSPLNVFLIMPAVVMSFLLYPLGLEQWAFALLELGMKAMLFIGTEVARLPFSNIYLPSFTATGFVVAFIGLYLFLLLKTRARLFGLAMVLFGFATIPFTEHASILVAERGKLIAVVDAKGELVMLRGGTKSFTSAQWAKAAGHDATITMKDATWSEEIQAKCDKEACTYEHGGITTLFVFNPKATKRLCDEIAPDAMVIRYYLYEGECEQVGQIIDRKRLNAAGAIDIQFTHDKANIRHARDLQGTRPWVTQTQR